MTDTLFATRPASQAAKSDLPTLSAAQVRAHLLARDTALEMTRRGPQPRLVEFEGVGHAPTLIADNQREVVTAFLLDPDSASDEKPFSGTG